MPDPRVAEASVIANARSTHPEARFMSRGGSKKDKREDFCVLMFEFGDGVLVY